MGNTREIGEQACLRQRKAKPTLLIRSIPISRAVFPAHAPFTDDTLLLEGGAIDSLGFLELMIFLGESFGIILDDEHFTPDNLGTPADLIAFVLRERRR